MNDYPAHRPCDEVIRLFLAAAGLEKTSGVQDTEEISAVEMVEFDRVHDMITSGMIRDGKTVIGVSLLRDKLQKKEFPDDFFM